MSLRFLFLSLLFIQTLYAQGQHSFGLYASLGTGTILKTQLDGDASYELQKVFGTELCWYYPIHSRLGFESGVSWTTSRLIIGSNLPPDQPPSREIYRLHWIRIPALMRLNLNSVFYASAGLLVLFDLSPRSAVQDQTGMGAALGMGAEIPIAPHFRLQIQPYVNFNGLLLSRKEGHFPERAADAGIRMGIRFVR